MVWRRFASLSVFGRVLQVGRGHQLSPGHRVSPWLSSSPSLSSSSSLMRLKRKEEEEEERWTRWRLRSWLLGSGLAMLAVSVWTWWRKGSLDPLLPNVQAAEVVKRPRDEEDNEHVDHKNKGKSRRVEHNFIADVVSEVAASLVYIEIKDPSVRDFYTGQPATASNGSGFIVEQDGLIITNAHVVVNRPRASVQVRLQDGRVFKGMVEAVDRTSDLATVRIACSNLPVMPLGSSASLRPGEFVIAMGSPLALSNTITTGVVSSVARNRAELGLHNGPDLPEYIQTDAAITFGNSGGPLVNLDGEAIGINSMKVTPGISFAIPIDYAKEFLKRAKAESKPNKTKTNQRRYMGITMLSLTPDILHEMRARLQLPPTVRHGVVVLKLVWGSPAEAAGVLPGDVVTHINGRAIHSTSEVYSHLESDHDLVLTVMRHNATINLTVVPEAVF